MSQITSVRSGSLTCLDTILIALGQRPDDGVIHIQNGQLGHFTADDPNALNKGTFTPQEIIADFKITYFKEGSLGADFQKYCDEHKIGTDSPLTVKHVKDFIQQEMPFTLEKIETGVLGSAIDYLQIVGQANGLTETHPDTRNPKYFPLTKAYSVLTRDHAEREQYRQGIANVRGMLLKKYDQNAVDRFDRHFAYRYYMGKPLTVRALGVFLDKEKTLRNDTVNISNLKKEGEALTLEKIETGLGKLDERTVIGGGKNKTELKKYYFPVIPIALSWFETRADNEEVRQGKADGITESKRVILEALPYNCTKAQVGTLFDTTFSSNKKTGELKVKALTPFVNKAIEARNHTNTLLGIIKAVTWSAGDTLETVKEKITAAANSVGQSFKDTWWSLGAIVAGAIELNTISTAGDPITLVAKGLLTGGVLVAESTNERILTGVMMHFVSGGGSSAGWSITSWFTGMFAKCALL